MSPIPENVNLLQQLMNNMTDNIFFKDRDSRFIMINAADAKWLGFDCPNDAVGKNDFDLFSEAFARRAREDEVQVMETGEPMISKEEKETWPDGSINWVSTSKVPLRDEDGNIVGLIGIGRDISDMKQKELELEEANRKLSEINDQVSEDLQMAARLQRTFLPQTYPAFQSDDGRNLLDFSHFHEADTTVSGDFCAVYKLSDTKAGLLICDVMGHGVRAALITSMIKTIADSLAEQSLTPGDFLTLMNRQLHPMIQTDDTFLFATASYLTIDAETGLLEGALAGHTIPFLIQPHKHQVEPLKTAGEQAGPALAVTANHKYETFSTGLARGDEVLLYTDGLSEAVDANHNEFGTDRLQQAIHTNQRCPLAELLPRIVQTVRAFSGNENFGDDICLLGVAFNA